MLLRRIRQFPHQRYAKSLKLRNCYVSNISIFKSSLKADTTRYSRFAIPSSSSLFQPVFRFYSDHNKSPFVVPVPSMGDSISEGTVIEWLVEPGQYVEPDEVVCVLETDKVSVDVRSPIGGILEKQLASPDDTVHVNAPLFHIMPAEKDSDASGTETGVDTSNKDTSSSNSKDSSKESDDTQNKVNTLNQDSKNATAADQSAETATETVTVPSMGDSISEGTIVQYVYDVGDYVEQDQVVVVIETDKVSVDVRAPKSGHIQKLLAKVDQVVEIGAPLFTLSLSSSPPTSSAPTSSPKIDQPAFVPAQSDEAPQVPQNEVPKAIQNKERKDVSPSQLQPQPQPQPTPLYAEPQRISRREKMSRMRLRTAERLKESQNVSASLTTFQEVDMTSLMDLRKRYKEAFETKHKVKLGFMSAFVRAASTALLEVPGVNAMLDTQNQEIVYREFVDMSVAVSTPKGLVTPILRNTESLGFADIEKKLSELAVRARSGKISLEEMTGGTFTISNGGVFGSLMGTPIINVPQTGILGMHATKMRPVVFEGKVMARPMMYLALTYDHRMVDGREAVLFLKSIVDKIEDPERLLLDL